MVNMYCSKCGKKVEDDAQFCGYCGYEILNEKEEGLIIDESKQQKKMRKTGRSIWTGIVSFFVIFGLIGGTMPFGMALWTLFFYCAMPWWILEDSEKKRGKPSIGWAIFTPLIGQALAFLVISNRGITPTEFWQNWGMVIAYMLIASGISIGVYESFVKGRQEK